jgi:hypothetical protein
MIVAKITMGVTADSQILNLCYELSDDTKISSASGLMFDTSLAVASECIVTVVEFSGDHMASLVYLA